MHNTELVSYHTVSSYELDSFGHVNNAVFLNYLEKARCDYLVQCQLSFNDFFKWKLFPVVIQAMIDFKSPAKAEDHLMIQGKLIEITKTSFKLGYHIINTHSNQSVARAETKHVFIDETNRPARIPELFKTKFIDRHWIN
jgi:acyl-CoA thioester hydrolase